LFLQDEQRVNIDHPSLDSPMWIEFTRSKNLTEEKILDKIQAVQQSKREFIEDCPFGNVVLACFTTAHKRDITVSQYCTLL
jgi:hypothetical protein